uniref:Uncharacterized protein n=1 Tax=viral metagenome TaxID=1070528 RepID=A0A6C0F8G3_9ZZZZ|tara:strand:- start:8525 stop:9070 length:546 start_codon:yes stop_codon:yes gene_type:complete
MHYKKGKIIKVNDKMQSNYSYILTASYGKKGFSHPDFKPDLTPKQILELGAFEGKYLNDCDEEFPKEWYKSAKKKGKLSPMKANPAINCFGMKSRLSLQEWKKRKWIPINEKDKDVRGWFQWYCRYYIGRRDKNVDRIQINRWKSYKRHLGQIRKNCKPGDFSCRPKQRQGLLQWAYNPFI